MRPAGFHEQERLGLPGRPGDFQVDRTDVEKQASNGYARCRTVSRRLSIKPIDADKQLTRKFLGIMVGLCCDELAVWALKIRYCEQTNFAQVLFRVYAPCQLAWHEQKF